MAEFKLGRIKFVWQGDWNDAVTYYKDDVVRYGGKTYICVVGHVSAADFYTDLENIPTRWNQVSDGQDWKGSWDTDTYYKVNDLVRWGGSIYICTEGHTSAATTTLGLEDDSSKWEEFAEAISYLSTWTTSTKYSLNDIVKYGGNAYICNTGHTSAATAALGLEADLSSWTLYTQGFEWLNTWTSNYRYKINDLVKYGGITYVCTTGHTSAASTALGLEPDLSNWQEFHRGIEYRDTWSNSAVRYRENDIVKYGAGTWICVQYHSSNVSRTFEQDVTSGYWEQFVEGLEFEDSWSALTTYQPGDIVTYGGYAYVSITNHINQTPTSNGDDWALLSTGFKVQSDWDSGTAYKVGDVVRLGGYTYVSVADGTNRKPPNAGYWSRLNSGIAWKGAWTNATAYSLGDAVRYLTSTYICVLTHTSATGTNRPDVDLSGTYWNLLAAGNENDVLTTEGDTVYYSGAGPTRLPVGSAGQIIMSNGTLPGWATYGVVPEVFYVGPNGADSPAPDYGLTIDRPWASVRYATEQIERGTYHPNARTLVEMNRTFIQEEIVQWVAWNIANPSGIWVGFNNDDEALCRRDMGLIVDALVYDMSHGSNIRTLEAAQSYFSGGSLITSILDEYNQLVAAINYGVTVIESVLANTPPAVDYQGLNGVSSPVIQFIDPSYTAESAASSLISSLAAIITDAVAAGTDADLPREDRPAYTISVKTGQYYEVLPIILPQNTAIVGDELRSTRISPAGSLIADNDKAKSVAALTRLQSVTDEIIANTAITPSAGNAETQNTTLKAGSTGSSTAVTRLAANADEIYDILDNGVGAADAYVLTTPTGYNTSYLAGYGDARAQILANTAFIKAEITAWIAVQVAGNISPFTTSFTYDSVKCARDVGYILDSLRYDLTYGGNLETLAVARAYFSFGSPTYGSGEKAATLAAYARLKTVVGQVIAETAVTVSAGNALTQDTSGTAGSAGSITFAQARIQDIYDAINLDGDTTNISYPVANEPGTSWVAAGLVAAKTALQTYKTEIQSDAVQYVKTQFPTLVFDQDICSRDVGYMIDALGYDLMFNSNFRSIQAGLAYYRGTSSAQLVVASQKAATLAIINFIKQRGKQIAASGATALADLLWTDIIGYINTGTRPIVTGVNTAVNDSDQINGALVLKANKEFLAAEAVAYINATYQTSCSATTGGSTDSITCTDTSWMAEGDAIRFTGTTFGGVSTGTTYYVHTVVSATEFKISEELDGSVKDLTSASGTMGVAYYYDSTACARDVRTIIDAMTSDLMHPGNYKSVLAARYYRNALTGSKLEDAFYVRNACGLRNMTFSGLDGTSDGNTTGFYGSPLLTANEYGTQRPRAGAYVSLDPGWGPNDYRAWTTNKSTYVQNVTTFGNGCVGQKIDGVLHNGGNDSIVSNDFTQVLSDGIGAWVTNLGRAELVSVFTYYNYIGYLAENGGKIRATNGNNSYGTYGSLAEGVDITETAITGQVDNRNTEADVRNIITSGEQILLLEYGNAGIDYTSASFAFSGTGSGVSAISDGEIRSGGLFNLRLTDPGDSSGPGGEGYITASNLAQSGNTTQITLAATDTNSSLAYVGMSIYITSGTGVGQYGVIATYNAGTKVATVNKESTGTSGWDHVIPGTSIASALDVTTSYTITPRLVLSAPSYTTAISGSLSATAAWSDIIFGKGHGTYTEILASSTSGGGSLATFTVTRVDGTYTVDVVGGGVLYDIDDTITINGASLGGITPDNNLVMTVTKVGEGGGGAILEVSTSGTAVTGKWVAVSRGGATASYSTNGTTWTTATLPASTNWTSVAYGKISGVGYWVAIATGGTDAAYSTDGISWTAATLPASANWTAVTYGNGRFVAIATGSTSAAFSTNGTSWSSMGVLPASTTWSDVNYGGGTFFAVATGGTGFQGAYSTNGTTWTASTMPSSGDWVSVAYGNSRFVAIATGGTGAGYSLNGTTWTAATLPSSSTWKKVRYGNGMFYAVAQGQVAASSPDGLTWTARSTTHASVTVTATAENIIGSFSDGTLPSSAYWTDMVTAGSTKIVAVGNDGSAVGYAAVSTNGTSWSALTIPSTAGWEFTSVAYNGTNKYVVFINNDRDVVGSSDGVTWTVQNTNGTNNLPVARTWSTSIYGSRFVVLANSGTNPVCYSSDGVTWTQGTLSNGSWSSVAYGQPSATAYFVAVSGKDFGGSQASAYSPDGVTWTAGNTMPSNDVWSSVTYGGGKFVAVAGDSVTATTKAAYSTNGTSWTAATMPGAAAKWVSVSYGGNAFMAFAYGSSRTAVSADGITWSEGPTISSGNWNTSTYQFDRFVAARTGPSTVSASINYQLATNYLTTTDTSTLSVNDMIVFQATAIGGLTAGTTYYVHSVQDATRFSVSASAGGGKVTLTSGSGSMASTAGRLYVSEAYGDPAGVGKWIAIAGGSSGSTVKGMSMTIGKTAKARAYVTDNLISEIWIHDPGSNYTSAPTLTITDPNNTGSDATYDARIGNGVLAQPAFSNRGSNYTAASVEIDGDGYADRYQVGSYIYVKNMTEVPIAGSNLQIDGIDDVYYRIVTVTELTGIAPGPYGARIQISPVMGTLEAPEHLSDITIRIRYSQVRLTGHDFLDIGTGNQTTTNYPGLPLTGYDPIPANETVDVAGGRVFYTSTDQDGNFRVGGLFNVEQATGVATLNADAFNIAGLQELQLGSVALGGQGATITEFSTDPFFTADSDSVVPTQRAIKAYITSQIGGGESSLNVNTLTAGIIYIAGSTITTTTNAQININTKMNFTGGVTGAPLALNYFLLR